MKNKINLLEKNPILFGIIILVMGFVIGSAVSILVVESKVASSASNDGWLGFFGGMFGSIMSGLVSFYILYLSRKETIKNQDEQRRNLEFQIRKQFTDDIANTIASYITDISKYYYDCRSNAIRGIEKHVPVDRGIAVEKYYTLQIKLKGIQGGKGILDELKIIHTEACFFDERINIHYKDLNYFEDHMKALEDETVKFIQNYLNL